MSTVVNLYMLLLGSTPPGRFTEQHDVFFDIGPDLDSLIPNIRAFWPEGGNKIHIDAWRPVTRVESLQVGIGSRSERPGPVPKRLFFINLGGYKQNEFDEFHYKILVAAADKGEAIRRSKETAFYRHTGFKGAESHIDDKYGVDVDDIHDIQDILPEATKEKYQLRLTPAENGACDQIRLGYIQLHKLQNLV